MQRCLLASLTRLRLYTNDRVNAWSFRPPLRANHGRLLSFRLHAYGTALRARFSSATPRSSGPRALCSCYSYVRRISAEGRWPDMHRQPRPDNFRLTVWASLPRPGKPLHRSPLIDGALPKTHIENNAMMVGRSDPAQLLLGEVQLYMHLTVQRAHTGYYGLCTRNRLHGTNTNVLTKAIWRCTDGSVLLSPSFAVLRTECMTKKPSYLWTVRRQMQQSLRGGTRGR